MIGRYLKNILIALDQGVNALAGGDPDETISSRVGKNYQGSWLAHIVDWLFGPRHCEQSIEPDEGKDEVIK